MTCRPFLARTLASALLAGILAAAPAAGECAPAGPDDERTAPAVQSPSGGSDFLLGRPRGWFGARGGWLVANAGSDLFDFVEDQLTIGARDFDAPFLALDVGFALTPRVDLVVGFEFSGASVNSEYRDYVDDDFLPITQRTTLQEFNLSVSGRLALAPRFRQVSSLASVPNRVVPYVGAGGGALHYKFKQTGDFVDYVDLSVFSSTLQSARWAPSVHVLGGIDLQLYRSWFATFEARYLWAAGDLGQDFVGFDPVDLAGFRASAGVSFGF